MDSQTTISSPPISSSPRTSETVIDTGNELFLHHSDHPSSSLASKPLDSDNYGHWRRAVEVSLMAKNKLGFVKGSCKRPDEGYSQSSQWDRCNNMVISWLLLSMVNEIVESVLYCETASEIWTKLEMRYGQANGAKIFQVQRELCRISQGNGSVSAYFTRIKRLWDEYSALIKLPNCTYGVAKDFTLLLQNQKLMQFLMGLNDSYKTVRGNILLISPLPTVSQAFKLVLQEEKQRDICSMPVLQADSVAMYSEQRSFGSYDGKGIRNHAKGGFSGQGNDNKQPQFCRYCKKQGHVIEKCFKLHGFPPGNNKNRRMAGTVQFDSEESTQHEYKENVVSGSAKDHSPQASVSKGHQGLNKEQFGQLVGLLSRLGGPDVQTFGNADSISNHSSMLAVSPRCPGSVALLRDRSGARFRCGLLLAEFRQFIAVQIQTFSFSIGNVVTAVPSMRKQLDLDNEKDGLYYTGHIFSAWI